MPKRQVSLRWLLNETRECFPDQLHIPEDALHMTLEHDEGRRLHAEIADALDMKERYELLLSIMRRSHPNLIGMLQHANVLPKD